jgi:hypothetical protein
MSKRIAEGVPLPLFVTRSTKFGADQVRFRRNFLPVAILPHSLNLYASELKSLVLRGDLRNRLRLSLLPELATAAALEQKLRQRQGYLVACPKSQGINVAELVAYRLLWIVMLPFARLVFTWAHRRRGAPEITYAL